MKTGYQHQIEAHDWSDIYIHEYFHSSILGGGLKIILSTSSGSEVINFVFKVISMVSFEHMEHLKTSTKSISCWTFLVKISLISALISGISARGLKIPDTGMNKSWVSCTISSSLVHRINLYYELSPTVLKHLSILRSAYYRK